MAYRSLAPLVSIIVQSPMAVKHKEPSLPISRVQRSLEKIALLDSLDLENISSYPLSTRDLYAAK